MLRIKVRRLRQGQHPSEVVVELETLDSGKEELIVDGRSLSDDSIEIGYPVGGKKGQLLVELPSETLSGRWRVWVSEKAVLGEAAA